MLENPPEKTSKSILDQNTDDDGELNNYSIDGIRVIVAVLLTITLPEIEN